MCARMIDLIFSFSLVDGWMDGLAVFLLCVRTIPFYLQKRREEDEDEDEEGKRREMKGREVKRRRGSELNR